MINYSHNDVPRGKDVISVSWEFFPRMNYEGEFLSHFNVQEHGYGLSFILTCYGTGSCGKCRLLQRDEQSLLLPLSHDLG